MEYDKFYMFVLIYDKDEVLFVVENDVELEEWIMVLNEEIKLIENLLSKWIWKSWLGCFSLLYLMGLNLMNIFFFLRFKFFIIFIY